MFGHSCGSLDIEKYMRYYEYLSVNTVMNVFFSMARYELEAGTAHKHDDLPKRVTSGASLQAWKFLHFLP